MSMLCCALLSGSAASGSAICAAIVHCIVPGVFRTEGARREPAGNNCSFVRSEPLPSLSSLCPMLGRSNGSSRALPTVRKSTSVSSRMDKAELALSVEGGATPKPSAAAGEAGWAQRAAPRGLHFEWAFLLCVLVLLAFSEGWQPFQRNFYVAHYVGATADVDLWHYGYPLKDNTVPAWTVPCIAVSAPLLTILGFWLAGRISRAEAHHAALLAISCVATTGLLTNWIKVNVGRPRPHFASRCWPGGLKPAFTPDGRPICADNAVDPAEGIKSFPSGHTSWSTSGLGFLSFWLLGKLRVFADGAPAPSRFVLSVSPLLGAVWIGMSRIQDYWHHWDDVLAGFSLGLLMAFLYCRQIYAGIMSQHAGMLTAAVRAAGSAGSSRSLAAPPSKYGLLPPDEPPSPLPLCADDRV